MNVFGQSASDVKTFSFGTVRKVCHEKIHAFETHPPPLKQKMYETVKELYKVAKKLEETPSPSCATYFTNGPF